MKKIYFILILMLSFCFPYLNKGNLYAEEQYVKVIYTSAYVFKQSEAIEENIVAEYKYGTEFLVIEANIQGEDYSYYKVKLTDVENISEAYVLSSQVIDTSIFTPQKELDTNAKLSNNAKIYILKGDNYVETDEELKEGTKIRLISGYDDSVKFSKIQYLNNDGEIITAYVKTTDIEVSHISRVLIGVIIIAVTSISIILILFGVKKSRKGGIKKIFKKNKN